MKKLMTAIAAVTAAFGLYADAPDTTGTSFEAAAFEADAPFDWTKDDEGGSDATYWFSTDTEVGTIKAYADGEAYSGTRPAQFLTDPQTKYLELDTSSPLTRYADKNKQAIAIEDTGLYFDQLVKFTAPSDADNVVDLAGGKIALWLKEIEADADKEIEAATNLMITAGFFEAADTIKQNDYTATIDGSTLVGKWARVTIKAIKITGTLAGFVVYIDGTAVATLDSIGTKPELNALGKKYADLGELFPSAVITGDDKQTISAVAFNGSGAIDDVSFTAVVPPFAKDEITFDLDWKPEDIASIKAGEKTLTPEELAEGSIRLSLPGDASSLAIVADPNGDYTVSLEAGEGATVDGMTFKFSGPASGSIVSKFNFFQVGDTAYPTFAEALAAVTEVDNTISLKKTCTIDADTIEEGIAINKNVTLDLAGNDLYIDDNVSIFDIQAAFTVVNSGETDAKIGIDATSKTSPVFAVSKGGSLTIGTEENQSKFVIVDGLISKAAQTYIHLYQGKFDKALNTEDDEFKYEPEDGYTLTSDDNYWIVQKEQAKGTVLLITNAGTTTNDYQTLALALAAAQSGDIVMPTATIAELQTTITVNAGVTLDLNNQIVNVDFHKTRLSNAGKIVIYNNSLALVNNWYIGGKFEAGEALTNASFLFPKGTQMDVAKQSAVQTAITITGDIQWGLPIESNKLVTVVCSTATINAKIYPTATLTVPNAITPTLTTIEGFEVKSTVGATMTTWAAEEKQEQVVKPGEPVGLGNGGEMTEEEAQAAAEKIPVVIDQADIEAGLTVDAVTVKAELIGGAWQAVLEPKTAPIIDETMAISVDEDTFSATVKNPVPGVYYGFVATDTLDGTTPFAPVGEYVRAKAGELTIGLDAPKGEGNACFYKLNAALRDPTVKPVQDNSKQFH